MELNVSNITALWQKICIPSIIFKLSNNRDKLWKLFSLTIFQKPQLQSVLIFFSFVFAVLFKHFVNVLSSFFYVSLELLARS